jgi:hypothetical protein
LETSGHDLTTAQSCTVNSTGCHQYGCSMPMMFHIESPNCTEGSATDTTAASQN